MSRVESSLPEWVLLSTRLIKNHEVAALTESSQLANKDQTHGCLLRHTRGQWFLVFHTGGGNWPLLQRICDASDFLMYFLACCFYIVLSTVIACIAVFTSSCQQSMNSASGSTACPVKPSVLFELPRSCEHRILIFNKLFVFFTSFCIWVNLIKTVFGAVELRLVDLTKVDQ